MNTHKYTLIITAIFSIIFTFCSAQITFAQDDQDVKWYENRDEALEAAKEQDKNILLLYGNNSCGNCKAAKRFLNEDPLLRKVVDESFILWYCNADTCQQGDDYYPGGSYYYPLLCVIDPYNPIPALAFTTGYKEASQIQLLLESNLPTFGDKWYRDRTIAFMAAKEQKKNILLLYGRNTCSRCNAAKEIINEAPVNKIINNNFILWYCNIDNNVKKEQGFEYRNALGDAPVPLPLLCIINPYDTIPALASTTGGKDRYEIQDFLNNNLPTANEYISQTYTKAYITGNMLNLSNTIENETIDIYTMSGHLIDSFEKTDNIATRNTSSYPKGVLLISSSEGWGVKLIKQ